MAFSFSTLSSIASLESSGGMAENSLAELGGLNRSVEQQWVTVGWLEVEKCEGKLRCHQKSRHCWRYYFKCDSHLGAVPVLKSNASCLVPAHLCLQWQGESGMQCATCWTFS